MENKNATEIKEELTEVEETSENQDLLEKEEIINDDEILPEQKELNTGEVLGEILEHEKKAGEQDIVENEEFFETEEDENYDEDSELDEEEEIKGLFEAVLFLSNEPLPISFFVKNFSIDATHAKIILDSIADEFLERDGGVILSEISNGFQFVTNARYSEQIRRALGFKKRDRLTKGMLETLSIVAYKQPIVLAEIDELRGVSSRMMVANLMKRNLIKPVGRKDLPGRPLAYGTTNDFLMYFGLNKLSDLPKLTEIKEFSIDNVE